MQNERILYILRNLSNVLLSIQIRVTSLVTFLGQMSTYGRIRLAEGRSPTQRKCPLFMVSKSRTKIPVTLAHIRGIPYCADDSLSQQVLYSLI